MTDAHDIWPERIDPIHDPPGVVAHHLKKYEFARSYVRGVVIDVACGVGYGTDFIASSTDKIVGLEIADDGVAVARERYLTGNAWFVQGDAEHLPFSTAMADAVTCFEGIEHFGDPEAHLCEVTRVLKADGVYLVSTPHPDAHPHGDENPYHLHEFAPEYFEGMLRARFTSVSVFGQRRIQTAAHRAAQRLDVLGLRRLRALRPLAKRIARRGLRTVPVDEATLDDFVIEPFDTGATEYIAVCREPMPP